MYSFSSQESTCRHESKSKQVVSALATTSFPWARFCSRNSISISDPAKPAMHHVDFRIRDLTILEIAVPWSGKRSH